MQWYSNHVNFSTAAFILLYFKAEGIPHTRLGTSGQIKDVPIKLLSHKTGENVLGVVAEPIER